MKGYNDPTQPALLIAVFVIDFYGYNVDDAESVLIKNYMTESNLDLNRQRYISLMVALVISDQPGETLLLGNNIGERINWTAQNSKYVLFHRDSKLMGKALTLEARRRLMLA